VTFSPICTSHRAHLPRLRRWRSPHGSYLPTLQGLRLQQTRLVDHPLQCHAPARLGAPPSRTEVPLPAKYLRSIPPMSSLSPTSSTLRPDPYSALDRRPPRSPPLQLKLPRALPHLQAVLGPSPLSQHLTVRQTDEAACGRLKTCHPPPRSLFLLGDERYPPRKRT
jgi:hypothetical protein